MNQHEFTKEQFESMTPEQVEYLKKRLEAPVPSTSSHTPMKEKDYTVRRKKIYKGKVIPKGYVFIVIKVNTKRGHVEAHQGIPGGQGQEYEDQVAENLRELIREKRGI